MVQPGIKAGNDLVREILAMGISKYRLAKDLGLSDTTVNNWVSGENSPSLSNFNRLQDYRNYNERIQRIPKPFGR